MKRVYQTKYGKENGNCFQACVASILELPLKNVPDFCNYKPIEDWYQNYIEWLQKRNISTITVKADDFDVLLNFKDCFVIITGDNSQGVRHSVIYKNGLLIHNPNKYCKGIKPNQIDILFPQDPSILSLTFKIKGEF